MPWGLLNHKRCSAGANTHAARRACGCVYIQHTVVHSVLRTHRYHGAMPSTANATATMCTWSTVRRLTGVAKAQVLAYELMCATDSFLDATHVSENERATGWAATSERMHKPWQGGLPQFHPHRAQTLCLSLHRRYKSASGCSATLEICPGLAKHGDHRAAIRWRTQRRTKSKRHCRSCAAVASGRTHNCRGLTAAVRAEHSTTAITRYSTHGTATF